MKKLLTVALTLFYGGGLMLSAQVPAPAKKDAPRQTVSGETVKVNTNGNSAKRTAAGPEWFIPSETIRAFNGGATSNYSYTTIFPDTNALFTYQGQSGNVTFETNINSVGLVFDPRSEIYDGNPFKTTKWSNYTVDSLKFTFFYRRFNTDANLVDTIIISTFDKTSMTRGFNGIYAGAVDYSRDRYRASGTGVQIYTLLLTADDTSSTAQERSIAVNKTIAASDQGSNWFGATVSYLPGYKGYNHTLPFDTVANFVTADTGADKVNTFRLLGYYDPSMFTESSTIPAIGGTRILNHGIVGEPTQRYRLVSTVDYYFPAFYTSAHLFPWIEFKVSSPNVSVNSLSKAAINNIYPNPVKGGDVIVQLNSQISSDANVEVTDINGKVVKSFSTTVAAGVNEISINSDELGKGMYFVTVKADGINTVSKLVVQ